MKKILLLLVLGVLFAAGCGGGGSETTAPEPENILTAETEAEIKAISADITRVEGDRDTVTLWVDLSFDPTSHEQIAQVGNEIADKAAAILDRQNRVVVNLMQSIEGSTDIRMFGTSRYNPGGKTEYKEAS